MFMFKIQIFEELWSQKCIQGEIRILNDSKFTVDGKNND